MPNTATLALRVSVLMTAICLAHPALAAEPPAVAAQPELTPAQKAAFDKLKPPGGVGGCIFMATPDDVRIAAAQAAAIRRPIPRAFQEAAAKAAPRCTTREFSDSDGPLVMATFSAVQLAALSVRLATQFALEQDRIEQTWAAAPAEQKAGYYLAADLLIAP